MASFLVTAIITILVIVISYLLNYFTKIFKILFTRPIKRKGAIEIDKKEHIYANPDLSNKLEDFDSTGIKTLYDVLQRGVKASGDRPLFSYRYSYNEPFKSYTYK